MDINDKLAERNEEIDIRLPYLAVVALDLMATNEINNVTQMFIDNEISVNEAVEVIGGLSSIKNILEPYITETSGEILEEFSELLR